VTRKRVRPVKRELIVGGGSQATTPSAWESAETGGERSRVVRSARRWMTAREQVASGEVHDRCEGKALKGGTQER
jgi:hypothetical protein